MFASLFTVTGLTAAFDDAVLADAKNGRVFRPFAILAANELGLPLVKSDDNPIGKPAFLKLAQQYRDDARAGTSAGAALRAWAKRAAVGVALDAIALALDPAAAVVGDATAWDALKPQRKAPVKKAAAPAVAVAVAPADDKPAHVPVPLGVALADALPVVLDAIKAGALAPAQRAALVAALAAGSPVAARIEALAVDTRADTRVGASVEAAAVAVAVDAALAPVQGEGEAVAAPAPLLLGYTKPAQKPQKPARRAPAGLALTLAERRALGAVNPAAAHQGGAMAAALAAAGLVAA